MIIPQTDHITKEYIPDFLFYYLTFFLFLKYLQMLQIMLIFISIHWQKETTHIENGMEKLRNKIKKNIYEIVIYSGISCFSYYYYYFYITHSALGVSVASSCECKFLVWNYNYLM